MLNYVDTIIRSFNNKLHYVITKTGIGELFNWMEGREYKGQSMDDALAYQNNQMAGYKTYPSTLNTDRMGQGVIRHSISDYAKDLGTYPDIPMDKGKGPDGAPDTFKNFLRGWFGASSTQNGAMPDISISDYGAETGNMTPINLNDGSATMQSTGQITPRIVTRAGSGAITPTAAGAIGISVILETCATEDVLNSAAEKLAEAVTPTETPSSGIPKVKLSATYRKLPYLEILRKLDQFECPYLFHRLERREDWFVLWHLLSLQVYADRFVSPLKHTRTAQKKKQRTQA